MADIPRQPPSGSLGLASSAPIIALKLIPAARSLALSGVVPSRIVSTPTFLSPAAKALTVSGATPTTRFSYMPRPASASLSLAGNKPLTTYAKVFPPAGSLTFTRPAPTLLIAPILQFTMTPAAASLALTASTSDVLLRWIAPEAELGLTAEAPILKIEFIAVDPYPNDPVNPGISLTAGSDVLYRQAAGFEKALADVDAQRLMAIYAEIIKDQWDPYKISYRNLPYLAWAMGVNLWENDWSEEFKRWWVDQQWTLKSQRGSELGLRRFVSAVNAEVLQVITPPARAYSLRKDTDAERAAYVARFAQLRLYPYVARVMLPWLCYLGRSTDYAGTARVWHENGSFLGERRKLYPTIQNQGGNYTRTSTLWDRGVETTLTMRKIARVQTGQDVGWGFTPGVSTYDEQIVLPNTARLCFMQSGQYFGAGFPHGIFPSTAPKLRTITIARSGKLELTQGKAQYQTTLPTVDLLKLEPELVTTPHPIRPTEMYAARRQYLNGKFLPRSNAWQYIYERWYIFDADRVPDYRRRGIYMGHARFGIHKYTAEATIKIRTKRPRFMAHTNGFVYGFIKKRDDEPINKVRRAVRASMALRDTVLLNTRTVRQGQVSDIFDASGRFTVGQSVSATV